VVYARAHPIVGSAQLGPAFLRPALQVLTFMDALKQAGLAAPVRRGGVARRDYGTIDHAVIRLLDGIGRVWIAQRQVDAERLVLRRIVDQVHGSPDVGPVGVRVVLLVVVPVQPAVVEGIVGIARRATHH
jgi:hypothetical protein